MKSGSAEESLGRFGTVFNNKQGKQLAGYVQVMDSLFYGLTRKESKKLVYDFTERNKVPHPFQNGAAADVWLMGFIWRYSSISLRSREATSVARAMGFSCPEMIRFCTVLCEPVEKQN